MRQIEPRLWQADFPQAKNFPMRAYLLANGEDQALLAIFHGGYHDPSSFEAAWNAIVPTVRFPVRSDLAELLRNGALQAQALAQAGFDDAYGPAGRQRWSGWNQRENTKPFSWMQLWWPLSPDSTDPAFSCTGLRSSARPIRMRRFARTWRSSGNGRPITMALRIRGAIRSTG